MSDSETEEELKGKAKIKRKGSKILGHIRKASGKIGGTESSEDLLDGEPESPHSSPIPVRRKGSWLGRGERGDDGKEPQGKKGKKEKKPSHRDAIDRVDDGMEEHAEEDVHSDNEESSRKSKVKSAPDLTRAQKLELMVCKLYDLGTASSQFQPKKKNALQKLLSKLSEEPAEEEKDSMKAYRQLNTEIQILSHELALSPRGGHASPALSIKALKVLGMVNMDLPAPQRLPQENQRSASFSAPTQPVIVHPRTKSMSAASGGQVSSAPASLGSGDAQTPVRTQGVVSLKAMKMLGVIEPSAPTDIKKGKSKNPADEKDGPTVTPVINLTDSTGVRTRSNSTDSVPSSPRYSSESDRSDTSSSDTWATRSRARTMSKEQVEPKSPLLSDRRERRARTMSKGS